MPSQMPTEEEKNDALQRLFEISNILNTGLDKETLRIIKQMCDQGINPQALAQVIKFLRKEGAKETGAHQSGAHQ